MSVPKPPVNLQCIGDQCQVPDWDYVFVGDGSGTGWSESCGWSCVVTERDTEASWILSGGFSQGTNNVAELMAYVQAAAHLLTYEGRRKSGNGTTVILVLTDSTYVVNGAKQPNTPTANRLLWRALEAAESNGLKFVFKWIPRDSCEENQIAHDEANRTRIAMKSD